MALNYTNWTQNLPTPFLQDTPKFTQIESVIYPNWDVWFEITYAIWQPWSVPSKSSFNWVEYLKEAKAINVCNGILSNLNAENIKAARKKAEKDGCRGQKRPKSKFGAG
jgi:gamma-glutamylcysteine synthetase